MFPYKRKKEKRMKKILFITLGLLIIGALAIANDNMTNEAIEKCVDAGHDYNYCVEGLK